MKKLGHITIWVMIVAGGVVIYDALRGDYRVTGYAAECAHRFQTPSDRHDCLDRKLVHYRDHELPALKAAAAAAK